MKLSILQGHTLSDTLAEVRRLSKQYKSDMEIFHDIPIKDMFSFIAKKITYEKDPSNSELVMRPLITLKRGKGDCDDKTVLFCAYFLYKNIPCGFSVVSNKENKIPHHIFPFILSKGQKIDMDATYSYGVPGQSKEWTYRKDYIL